ncbi:MAG: hypothetical protein RLZ12_607 [Bacillota bacterium]|jgi:predicted Zn-dependent peptidase
MNEEFVSTKIGDIGLHLCSTPKFKTNLIMLCLAQELNPCHVTKHALLPMVLKRGTKKFPTNLLLNHHLDELYGADLFNYVVKMGNAQLLILGVEICNEQYLPETGSSLCNAGAKLLSELLTQPALEEGYFKKTYVSGEKKILAQRIKSLLDDKGQYAKQRTIEELCANDPYALFSIGRAADLPLIDEVNLYKYYHDILRNCPLDLYFIGNLPPNKAAKELEPLLQNLASYSLRQRRSFATTDLKQPAEQVNYVNESQKLQQAKLNLGCTTSIAYADPNYPALMVYNGLLGSFPHSKLFQNVREKASLAYYASSSLESHKGLLLIHTGIDPKQYDEALKIIQEQLQLLKAGSFTKEELDQTKQCLINRVQEQQDDTKDLALFHYAQLLSGSQRTKSLLLQELASVTPADITRIAERVQINTVYFLS